MTSTPIGMWVRTLGLLATAALVACGSDPTCKDGCDKVRACGLRTSGLACSSGTTGCTTPESHCAQCLADTSCDELRGGACASACTGFRP